MKKTSIAYIRMTYYQPYNLATYAPNMVGRSTIKKSILGNFEAYAVKGIDVLKRNAYYIAYMYIYDDRLTFEENKKAAETISSHKQPFMGTFIPAVIQVPYILFYNPSKIRVPGKELLKDPLAPDFTVTCHKNVLTRLFHKRAIKEATATELANLSCPYLIKSPTNKFIITSQGVSILEE